MVKRIPRQPSRKVRQQSKARPKSTKPCKSFKIKSVVGRLLFFAPPKHMRRKRKEKKRLVAPNGLTAVYIDFDSLIPSAAMPKPGPSRGYVK